MTLIAGSLQARQCELRGHFFALRPVVIGVALKATRFRVFWPRRVAFPAGGDAGNQKFAIVAAGQGLGMAAVATEAAMGIVIKLCMRHPLGRDLRLSHNRQTVLPQSGAKRMTLIAGLAP